MTTLTVSASAGDARASGWPTLRTMAEAARRVRAGRGLRDGIGYVEAVVLGVVEGLTEFLPISAHGAPDASSSGCSASTGRGPGRPAFTAVIQLGAILAAVLYFRRDISRIVAAWFRGARPARAARATLDCRLGWYVIVGTIPIGDRRPGAQGRRSTAAAARPAGRRGRADRLGAVLWWPSGVGRAGPARAAT